MHQIKRILTLVELASNDQPNMAECISLAKALGAELHLLNVVPPRTQPKFGSSQKLEQAKEQLGSQQLTYPGVQVHREVREGKVLGCVKQYVDEHHVDLVVIDQSVSGSATSEAFKQTVCQLRSQLAIPILWTDSARAAQMESMSQAFKLLTELHGDTFEGLRDNTLQIIQKELETEFALNEEDSTALMTRLVSSGALVWEPTVDPANPKAATGRWKIQPGKVEAETSVQFHPVEEGFDGNATAAVSLIERAIESNATDIHIDPVSPHRYVVQFRVDGRMLEFCHLHEQVAGVTIKQLKLMANVSLEDPFQPHESRLTLPPSISGFDIRLTCAPVVSGEAIALRLINQEMLRLPLSEIGLSTQSFATVYRMLHRRSGLILISGPTGAGKTTTTYSIINVLVGEQQKIISIEDPVELVVPFMRQLSVDERHGLTARAALSTVLRMDPDAVFIGEIRDREAAQIALQAASSGKRGFSTIHMRDVAATITALQEFGIDAKTVASNLSGIIAQRLVRRICSSCAEYTAPTKHEATFFESQMIDVPDELARARGCSACRGAGYRGRIGIFETVIIDEDLASAIIAQAHEGELREIIHGRGLSLMHDGLGKVREGVTTIAELQETAWLQESLANYFNEVIEDEDGHVSPSGRASALQ